MEYFWATIALSSVWLALSVVSGLMLCLLGAVFLKESTVEKHGSRILFWFGVASLTILFVMITALGRSVTIEKARQECRAVKPAVQLII